MVIQNEEFIQEFVEEASLHVENVEAELLKIDETDVHMDSINSIFRGVHSIKGTAGFFGLSKIVKLAHTMENIFGEIRSERLKFSNDMIDILLSANDKLKQMIENVATSEETDIDYHVKEVSSILNKESDSSIHSEISKNCKEEREIPEKDINIQNETITNGLKHGHKVYKLNLKLNADLDEKNIDPISFIKKIESIGNIVDSFSDISAMKELQYFGQTTKNDINISFIFTSVLEKRLLPMALEVSEDNIEELDANMNSSDIYELLRKEHKDDSENIKNINKGTEDIRFKEKIEDEEEKALRDNKDITKNNTVQIEDTIRVHVSLLNNILNLASEMVLARNQLLRSINGYKKNIPGIDPILQNVNRITTELQEKIMQTRMQPIGNVFNKFPRIIRDLSKEIDKNVDLELEGTDVELDKSIIEALGDPLSHLVRNAIDHGLESAEERLRVGKPRTGTIIMKAYHEAGCVNIDIIDDGVGINSEYIAKKALEKEVVSDEELNIMGENDILQLIFKPGFSTAEKVTNVSGRGVGMDVVKTNIEKLGGTIEIYTEPGRGTTFRLILPLTLAIISSLIVEVEGVRFALPKVNLQELVRIISGDDSKRIEYINGAEVLRLREKLLPIVHLSDVLSLKKDVLNKKEKNTQKIQRVLVLKIGARRFGLVVDKIYDEEEILVKPLPKYIKNCKAYSGVTILGDGKTSLILDPEGIITKSKLKFVEEENSKELLKVNESIKEQNKLLIFKCTGEENLAIDLTFISRVEKIHVSEIESIGEREYIKYRGSSLRVIRPEHYLHINKEKRQEEYSYVIIPKLVRGNIGILVNKIYDTVQTNVNLSQDDIRIKGVIGSTILNNKIILLLNIYELLEKALPEYYSVEKSLNTGDKKTILLVEDTPLFLELEKNYLEDGGYNVLTALNGNEGLKILGKKNVDAVISDIQMPVMDGLEFIKKIRENKEFSHIPVIALTSMLGESNKKEGLDAGFDFYEYKLDKENLLNKLKQIFD